MLYEEDDRRAKIHAANMQKALDRLQDPNLPAHLRKGYQEAVDLGLTADWLRMVAKSKEAELIRDVAARLDDIVSKARR